jgi:hypothetical protein
MGIKDNIAIREAADEATRMLTEVWSKSGIDGKYVDKFFRRVYDQIGEIAGMAAPEPGDDRGMPVKAIDVEEADELSESIFNLVDNELPEDADDFGGSVAEKTRAIMQKIESTGRATDGQLNALTNMEVACRKWIR